MFKYAVRKMYETCRDLLERNELTIDDISIMIPHQANRRIITAAAERLGMSMEKVLVNIDRYGNTTAGTIPLGHPRRHRARTSEEGRHRALRRGRARVHRRRQSLALGLLGLRAPGFGRFTRYCELAVAVAASRMRTPTSFPWGTFSSSMPPGSVCCFVHLLVVDLHLVDAPRL